MRYILSLSFLIVAASNANAAAKGLAACEPDAARLCAGQRSVSLCLVEQESELSPDCAAMVSGWSKKGARSPSSSWLGACSADAETLCAGKTSISLCLIDREDALSPGCAALVATWEKKHARSPSSWLGACSKDAEKLCAGKRSINLCMMEHKKEWSPACRESQAPAPAKKGA